MKKSCGDEACEELVVPSGDFALKAEAVFARGFSDQVEGDVVQRMASPAPSPALDYPASSWRVAACSRGGDGARKSFEYIRHNCTAVCAVHESSVGPERQCAYVALATAPECTTDRICSPRAFLGLTDGVERLLMIFGDQ